MLTQFNQNAQPIVETEDSEKPEPESLTAAVAEAKPDPPGEIPDKEVEPDPMPETTDTAAIDPPASEKTGPDIPPEKDKPAAKAKETEDDKLFKGPYNLEIVSPSNHLQPGEVPEWLKEIHGLKAILKNGYDAGKSGNVKYNIVLNKPVPLVKILKSVPSVKFVTVNYQNILLILK